MLIEYQLPFQGVSLETKVAGERPGDALLLFFNSPFSGLSRLSLFSETGGINSRDFLRAGAH